MSTPLVSILMPMLNARRFVREAIQSILTQTSVDVEVIVVDDGSTDGSAERVRELCAANVKLIQTTQRGVATAFNLALEQAAGTYLARCDADDLYLPGRLAGQVTWLENHLEFGAVCGGFSTITTGGSFICNMHCGPIAEEITSELAMGETRTSFCTWLTRTSLVRMAGGCRQYFRLAEDIDLQFRLSEFGRVWFEPEPCYLYRLHDASVTHTSHSKLREFFDDAARHFARQRRAEGIDDLERGSPPKPPLSKARDRNGSKQHVQDLLLGVAWDKLTDGHPLHAVRTGLRACLIRPMNFEAWKNLGVLVIRGQRT